MVITHLTSLNNKKEFSMAKGSGLTKKQDISDELEAVVGRGPLSRAEITKKVWAYIKKNNLQDEDDGRMIVPDDTLAEVTGAKPFDMMKLAGKLSPHIG